MASSGQAEDSQQRALPMLPTAVVLDRVKGALYGLLIADALAAPTHWFYGGPRQVIQLYGKRIQGYTDPVQHLPGSIMSKSNTGGGGRGGYKGNIIGDVIFHNKKQYWEPGKDYHYHNLLRAGDNTLEALLTRRVMAVSVEHSGPDLPAILDDYVEFMTTPDSHNDTYAGTCHRMFFANRAAGKPLDKCPDNDHHNVDSIDALVTPIPLMLLPSGEDEAAELAGAMVRLTRDSPVSANAAGDVSRLLRQVVRHGADLRSVLASWFGASVEELESQIMRQSSDQLTACYLSDALPAAAVLAFKYAEHAAGPGEAFRTAVLANANRGGENVGSGALIGALLGGQAGFEALPKDLVDGLARSHRPKLDHEIDGFINLVRAELEKSTAGDQVC